jgi:hypothetical protein
VQAVYAKILVPFAEECVQAISRTARRIAITGKNAVVTVAASPNGVSAAGMSGGKQRLPLRADRKASGRHSKCETSVRRFRTPEQGHRKFTTGSASGRDVLWSDYVLDEHTGVKLSADGYAVTDQPIYAFVSHVQIKACTFRNRAIKSDT